MHGNLAFPAKYAWIFGHAIVASRNWVSGPQQYQLKLADDQTIDVTFVSAEAMQVAIVAAKLES